MSPPPDPVPEGDACPRCSGPLSRFRLDDRAAVVCEDCGFVGVPADHHATPGEAVEPWASAVERARREAVASAVRVAVESADPAVDELFEADPGGDNSWRPPERRVASDPVPGLDDRADDEDGDDDQDDGERDRDDADDDQDDDSDRDDADSDDE